MKNWMSGLTYDQVHPSVELRYRVAVPLRISSDSR